MPSGSIPVIANLKPLPLIREADADVVCAQARAGLTLAEILGSGASQSIEVRVGGEVVPRVLWAKVKPKAGTLVHVTMYPQGGSARKWVAIIAMVALTIVTYGAFGWQGLAATAATAYGGTAAAWAAGIMLAGSLAISALVAPPTPKLGAAGGDPFQQLQSITGTSNQANPYGVIPCVVGTYRFFPCHAALPYTEIVGNDQYLRMLLDLGYGDLDISDIQIGDTAIDQYDGVQYEITTTPTLFTQDIYEAAVGIPLTKVGDSATRTTQTATTQISLDLVAQNGLFSADSKGNIIGAQVTFHVEYAPTGSGAWTSVLPAEHVVRSNLDEVSGNVRAGSSRRATLRTGLSWPVPKGQYDVRVTRVLDNFPNAASDSAKSGDFTWTVLRSMSPQNPSTTGTLKLALRIKASDQLNGGLPQVSVLAAQKIGQWDWANGVWLPVQETQNPAWIYAWLLTRCPAIVRRLPDARIDLDGIGHWADECAAKGYKVSFVMDSARPLFDVLKDVLACGRATFGVRNGKYTAIRDLPQAVPVQMFTPSNSWGFSYSRAFTNLPHALRCKFVNPQAGYKQDYVTVYAPGYSAASATRFEELDLGPVVDPDAAWKLGMYYLAVGYNRPTTYTLNADIEHMVCERGDLVRVAHDVTAWGQAWGRVKAVAPNGLTVTLDGPVDLAAGTQYQLQVRKADGTQARVSVTSAAGAGVAQLTLSATTGAAPGDLWVLGTVNHGTADLLVKEIVPSDNLTAELTLVDAAPAVWAADAGTPPPFVSNITNTAWCEAPEPPQLQLVVTGTRDDAGVHTPGVNVSMPPQGGIYRQPLGGRMVA